MKIFVVQICAYKSLCICILLKWAISNSVGDCSINLLFNSSIPLQSKHFSLCFGKITIFPFFCLLTVFIFNLRLNYSISFLQFEQTVSKFFTLPSKHTVSSVRPMLNSWSTNSSKILKFDLSKMIKNFWSFSLSLSSFFLLYYILDFL